MRIHRPLSLIALTLSLGAACLNPGAPPADTDTDTDTETTTTTSTTSGSTTVDPTETTGTTTTPMAECGNGMVEAGEECDNGEDNADDAGCTASCKTNICGDSKVWAGVEECDDGNQVETDACLNSCASASCGDGQVYAGVEACDDAVNDGAYDGCNPGCEELGPRCGDGVLQEDKESCDDLDITTGCLKSCVVARNCAEIKADYADAASGLYTIDPASENIPAFTVFCEMEADGGGYTLAKVGRPSGQTGVQAEAVCAAYGMHLFVPRTPAHLLASYQFATTANMTPLEVQDMPVSSEYLAIMGIYPVEPKMTCLNKPLNSEDCPEWRATDDGPFWVTDQVIEDEPGTNNCANCSMLYEWNGDGTVQAYQAIGLQGGGKSPLFLCSIGDK
ncbi:MAG: DUF4215 domain-containing protein [Nannocystis sp.]|nr:DUF4215 domain-containing protein [Nannocystis sp.]